MTSSHLIRVHFTAIVKWVYNYLFSTALLFVIMASFDDAVASVYSFLGLQATSNVAIIWSMLVTPVILGLVAATFSTESTYRLRLSSSVIVLLRSITALCILFVILFLLGILFPFDSSFKTQLVKDAYYVVFATAVLLIAIVLTNLFFSSKIEKEVPSQITSFLGNCSSKKIVSFFILLYAALGWFLFSYPLPLDQQYLMFVISGTYYETIGLALSLHVYFLLGIIGGLILAYSGTENDYFLQIPKSSFWLSITHSVLIGLAYTALGYFSTVYFMFFSSLVVSIFLFSLGGILALMISGEKPLLSA